MSAPSSPSRAEVDGIAAWTVIRAARELARRLAVELEPLEISPVEFGVLAQLAAAEGLDGSASGRASAAGTASATGTASTASAGIAPGTTDATGRADGLRQADLARAVGVRPQSMTALVAGLTTRALLVRRADPGRGRHSRLALTDAGRALLADAWPLVTASDDWFAGDATDTEALVATLHPLLGTARGGVGEVP
ncbi:MarR family winged helix-turn-helix transcriptional regulator [Frigoribacterium sp. RIT-PI-h]|uniref:MarR family winged helix-turn-helix transcriptional regulator n=1 Tax=Frigoribacterium sp. RIT-PI-h TaxID=1690245 RepID=UPI0006B8948E|nr:MarR family transcriptional regulator [Frigoribacterium sp. RIT-PI-h]